MRLRIEGVGVELDGRRIVEDIDLVAEPGSFLGVVGPNGSGKSTLLRTVYHAVRPCAGLVAVDDAEVWQMSARRAAQRIAAVTQEAPPDFDLRVREVVAMGRSPHKGPFDRDGAADEAIVEDALRRTGTAVTADRWFSTLSGGEKQRVLIARALAQQSRLLVLDEPTNHLDIHYQLQVLDLVRGLGLTVVAALHDLNLAAAYCDELVVLAAGQVWAAGRPEDVLTEELLADVFGVQAHRGWHPTTGRLQLSFTALPAERTTER